jgi:peptide/nickel transport system permease protein
VSVEVASRTDLPVRTAVRDLRWTRALFGQPTSLLGLVLLVFVVTAALAAPLLTPYAQEAVDVEARLQPRLPATGWGPTRFGRDILTRVLYGARVSLVVGLLATALATAAGAALGAVAAFYGGAADEFLMRLMDVLLAFPYIVLAIAVAAVLGPSLPNLILAIAVIRVPQFARVTRGAVLSVKQMAYVEAARAAGASPARVLWRHVLPNCLNPVVVLATLSAGTAINAEAALSFLGLGIQPPASSWGTMLADGRRFLLDAPWIATFPGLAISLTVLGCNLVGDALRDALDPTTARR